MASNAEWVRLLAPVTTTPNDDEERAGEHLADDEPDAEPERLQPACLHDRDRRRERERAEPREQRVQKQLKGRVDHRDSGARPGADATLRQRRVADLRG